VSITATLIIQIIVLLILVGVTMKYIWPPITAALDERAQKVAEGLSAADKARSELASANKRIEDELAKARNDAATRLANAERMALQIVEDAKAKAADEGAKIVAQAQAEAQQEATKAREALRDQVAALAVKGAEQILRREVSPAVHAELLNRLQTELLAMAEPSTIARPYAAALFQASTAADGAQLVAQLDTLAGIAADAGLRQFAADPRVSDEQVFGVVTGIAGADLNPKLRNLLSTVIDNGRLSVLPEIASQFRTLVNDRGGIADAQVVSAFPLDAGQQASLAKVLEKRFGRQLKVAVAVDPTLIGGVRVTVGDEVLDTSVVARLEQMRAALTH
jgi:F-type H+-transporting ATPase subunit b